VDQKTENRLRAIEETLDEFATRLEKLESFMEERADQAGGEEEAEDL
jgi:hypothetical protein